MSYKIRLKRKDRIAARFLMQLQSTLAKAAIEAKKTDGLTQKKIADELGVDRSVISRILKGQGNPTARTIAEFSAAMGYRPELLLHKIGAQHASSNAALTPQATAVVLPAKKENATKSDGPMITWSPSRQVHSESGAEV